MKDKRALVTGAGSGLGKAIAAKLASEGATVVVADIDDVAAQRAVDDIASTGGHAFASTLDVTSESDWDRLATDANIANLEVLINAAGVFARVGHPIDVISLDEWRRILGVNLEGAFLGTRFGVRMMKTNGRGSIVNIGSIAGALGSRGGAAYGASKGGVHTLTKQAALSCARAGYGIRVNAILPGYVLTSGTAVRAIEQYGSWESAHAALASRNPLNVSIEGEDIGWAALYLASEESRAVTGIELVVDGGAMATLWGV
jgi:NAD(P)-dependent dehydrogenase (short-subunit alcohol dehydrogenase family)